MLPRVSGSLCLVRPTPVEEQAFWARPGLEVRDGRLVMPPTILTEAVAQVGAILILAKPENRQRLPLFAGIQQVRYRKPVYPGDVVEIEATVIRLRNRMGLLRGVARVNGQSVVHGSMTFALAPPQLVDAAAS